MKKILICLLIPFWCANLQAQQDSTYQKALDSEAILNAISALYDTAEVKNILSPALEKVLDDEWDAQYKKVKAAYARFFENHINDSIGQAVFTRTSWGQRRLSIEQLETILSKAGPEFQETKIYASAVIRLERMKLTAPGTSYQEIVSKSPEGKEIKLSDYVGKGKYVLLDFWASWCPPCRKEMPHLIELYNQYKDKNFEIIGYSLDRNEEAWKKGIHQLQIPWPQMSDCAFWQSTPVQLYDVHGIPSAILIDPEGKIVQKELTGSALTELLRQLFQ
ncbi:MAG: Thiol-disulfide oxidoreductase ResA [Candidatus Ordinivivax streblomastigis]|uniref:Thiol-disulfide oxidoreductase ResA n=1 Tax=Candidatus Ordinivivax streblomastigis TaxID=2540710 RepID=A0A5M8NUB2_9BACT|nr:MAG: Thiol-disulfide oxidoreductase ResA [Candidatus Ordinivivax streblomastigis]